MERAWAAGGAAIEIMEDIEQTWAAGGDAEGELELAHLRASQVAQIDARHNRLQGLDELEEDGNGGDEAQEEKLGPAWQGQMYTANDGSGNGDWREEDGQDSEADHGQRGIQEGGQQERVYDLKYGNGNNDWGEDGHSYEEAQYQDVTYGGEHQGWAYNSNDGNGNGDCGGDEQGYEEEQEQGATHVGGDQQGWVYAAGDGNGNINGNDNGNGYYGNNDWREDAQGFGEEQEQRATYAEEQQGGAYAASNGSGNHGTDIGNGNDNDNYYGNDDWRGDSQGYGEDQDRGATYVDGQQEWPVPPAGNGDNSGYADGGILGRGRGYDNQDGNNDWGEDTQGASYTEEVHGHGYF